MLAMAGSALALPEAPSLEAAKPIAQAENRAILLDLTGKDWCPGCVYLKGKILDTEVMDKAMGDKYILVEIDYPRDPKKIAAIPEEERVARENIIKTFKVRGLPCVIYMDAEGLPYAVVSEYTRTPEEYIEKIMKKAEEVRAARDAAFAKAATLQGQEKAKALVDALELLPEVCRGEYKAVLEEIRTLDPENTLGYSRIEEDAALRIAQLNAWESKLKQHMAGQQGARTEPANVESTIQMCEEYLKQEGLIPEVRQKAVAVIAEGYAFLKNVPMVYAMTHRAVNEAPGTEEAARLQQLLNYYDSYLLEELKMTEAAHEAARPYMKPAPEAAPAPAAK